MSDQKAVISKSENQNENVAQKLAPYTVKRRDIVAELINEEEESITRQFTTEKMMELLDVFFEDYCTMAKTVDTAFGSFSQKAQLYNIARTSLLSIEQCERFKQSEFKKTFFTALTTVVKKWVTKVQQVKQTNQQVMTESEYLAQNGFVEEIIRDVVEEQPKEEQKVEEKKKNMYERPEFIYQINDVEEIKKKFKTMAIKSAICDSFNFSYLVYENKYTKLTVPFQMAKVEGKWSMKPEAEYLKEVEEYLSQFKTAKCNTIKGSVCLNMASYQPKDAIEDMAALKVLIKACAMFLNGENKNLDTQIDQIGGIFKDTEKVNKDTKKVSVYHRINIPVMLQQNNRFNSIVTLNECFEQGGEQDFVNIQDQCEDLWQIWKKFYKREMAIKLRFDGFYQSKTTLIAQIQCEQIVFGQDVEIISNKKPFEKKEAKPLFSEDQEIKIQQNKKLALEKLLAK